MTRSLQLGVFPPIAVGEENPYTLEMQRGWISAGHVLRNIDAHQLFLCEESVTSLDILHINWSELIAKQADAPLNRVLRAAMLSTGLSEFYGRRVTRRIVRRLQMSGVKIVYTIHDLSSNWLKPGSHLDHMDRAIKNELLGLSDAWVTMEESSLNELPQSIGRPTLIAHCPLGDYRECHGPSAPQDEARARLGLKPTEKVFLLTGYLSPRRPPNATITAFLDAAQPDWRLIIASRNIRDFKLGAVDPRVIIFPHLLDHSTYRDLFCATDWCIMSGQRYLNSSIVRTAVSYSRPVICWRFGSQIDLLAGGAVWLDQFHGNLPAAIKTAGTIPPVEYSSMCATLERQNAARPWSLAHDRYAALLAALCPTPQVRSA